MRRSARAAKPRSRDAIRQTIVVIALGSLIGLGLFGTNEYVKVQRRAEAAAQAPSPTEINTGSILIMPDQGDACRQIIFDNRTGQLNDNGVVDCQRAAYQGTDGTPKRLSSARVRVIASGFRGH
jgi:hypothetical protein